jgi:GDPmannose 4,6-dehydratase
MTRALISGVAGQDGSYLAEYLLSLGYEVHGIVRRHSVAEHQEDRIHHLGESVTTHYGDLTDAGGLERIVAEVRPDEVYNLGAQSHVRISFDIPQFTAQVNAIGAMNMIEACRRLVPRCRYYQASSSEMFGLSVDADGYQREGTPMVPTSPYGIAKVFAYNTVRHYRRAYGMHATNGILFNHESKRRGSNFVTAKVAKGAVLVYRGYTRRLEMGNLDSARDWGHSSDYVQAMHLMLQQPEAGDWIVATGEARTVGHMCAYAFDRLGLNYRDYVVQEPRFMRPEELPYLRGDSSRIRALGWAPRMDFRAILDEMVDHWLERIPPKEGR